MWCSKALLYAVTVSCCLFHGLFRKYCILSLKLMVTAVPLRNGFLFSFRLQTLMSVPSPATCANTPALTAPEHIPALALKDMSSREQERVKVQYLAAASLCWWNMIISATSMPVSDPYRNWTCQRRMRYITEYGLGTLNQPVMERMRKLGVRANKALVFRHPKGRFKSVSFFFLFSFLF